MDQNDKQKNYVLETRKHFSNIIREILGYEPRDILISNEEKIKNFISKFVDLVNQDVKKMSYIWWWRGGSNNHLYKFQLDNDYQIINHWMIKIKEIYINISPISIFDFIIVRTLGEDNDNPHIENYEWTNNEFSKIDISKHEILDFSIRETAKNGNEILKQPYNFLLTAQFGVPNLNVVSDASMGIQLNKLLFGDISYKDFRHWYTNPLISLKSRIEDFYNYLIKFPMLGMKHKLGVEMSEKLAGLGSYEIVNRTFYRARELKQNVPYDEDHMWNPPRDRAAIYEGRYNHFGQSFLYMAGDKVTAFKEVIPPWHSACSLIEIAIEEPLNVLDLRRVNFYSEDKGLDYIILHYMLVHEGSISKETSNPYTRPEYLVPRFVADCARLNSFDGILFNSTKSQGDNLVLFEPDQLREQGKVISKLPPYLHNLN